MGIDPINRPFSLEHRAAFAPPSSGAAAFRADTDQSGEWYVWTRLSSSGWATMQRCDSRELAQRLADDLNQQSLRVAV